MALWFVSFLAWWTPIWRKSNERLCDYLFIYFYFFIIIILFLFYFYFFKVFTCANGFMPYFAKEKLHLFRVMSFPYCLFPVRFSASTFSPMSIIKDFVENTSSALGRQVSESVLFDNTIGARSRLNSAYSVASLSFKFLTSFRSHNLLTTFHVNLIVTFLLWESLYKSG